MITHYEEKVLAGNRLSREEALELSSVSGNEIYSLFHGANRIRNHFRGDKVDLCAIINAKSGGCSEDCAYCAQSSYNRSDVRKYSFLDTSIILDKAAEARRGGAKRFCIVTSGKKATRADLSIITGIIPEIRALGLLPCATLGLLSEEEILLLKDAGLERYHHNLEASEEFFSRVCTTHTYAEKLKTIRGALSAGISLCSGGIFGMGETWEDRIDMALALRDLNPDSIPINFLMPIEGTRLENQRLLEPLEALKIVSVFRFLLFEKEIRVCGGRVQTLGELNSSLLHAGADGLLTGNYLTTLGRTYEDDLQLIEQSGLRAG